MESAEAARLETRRSGSRVVSKKQAWSDPGMSPLQAAGPGNSSEFRKAGSALPVSGKSQGREGKRRPCLYRPGENDFAFPLWSPCAAAGEQHQCGISGLRVWLRWIPRPPPGTHPRHPAHP